MGAAVTQADARTTGGMDFSGTVCGSGTSQFDKFLARPGAAQQRAAYCLLDMGRSSEVTAQHIWTAIRRVLPTRTTGDQ
jgi:hypothetical protein